MATATKVPKYDTEDGQSDPYNDILVDLRAPLIRLGKDIKKAAIHLTRNDARWLVDFYYTTQDNRIRTAHQQRTSAESQEPRLLLDWVFASTHLFETSLKAALGEFAGAYRVGCYK